jgi:hypothetical protein
LDLGFDGVFVLGLEAFLDALVKLVFVFLVDLPEILIEEEEVGDDEDERLEDDGATREGGRQV